MFEGTDVSVGRGTDHPFEVFGSPNLSETLFNYSFMPVAQQGATHPPHEGKLCYGRDLSDTEDLNYINLEWLIETYQDYKQSGKSFFNNYFHKLAGTHRLRAAIEKGGSSKRHQGRLARRIGKI